MWQCGFARGGNVAHFGDPHLEVELGDEDHWLNLGISCVDLQQKDALEVWSVGHATSRTLNVFMNHVPRKEFVHVPGNPLVVASGRTRGYNFVREFRQNRFVTFQKGLALRLVCKVLVLMFELECMAWHQITNGPNKGDVTWHMTRGLTISNTYSIAICAWCLSLRLWSSLTPKLHHSKYLRQSGLGKLSMWRCFGFTTKNVTHFGAHQILKLNWRMQHQPRPLGLLDAAVALPRAPSGFVGRSSYRPLSRLWRSKSGQIGKGKRHKTIQNWMLTFGAKTKSSKKRGLGWIWYQFSIWDLE